MARYARLLESARQDVNDLYRKFPQGVVHFDYEASTAKIFTNGVDEKVLIFWRFLQSLFPVGAWRKEMWDPKNSWKNEASACSVNQKRVFQYWDTLFYLFLMANRIIGEKSGITILNINRTTEKFT